MNNGDRHVSRLVAYVKSGLSYRRRLDLEQEDFSSIWIEVGLQYQRKFLLAGVYREWNHLQTEEDSEDHSSKLEQETRWEEFVTNWEIALNESNDVTVIGDINIDLDKVFRDDYRGECRKMADLVKDYIEVRGVSQLVAEKTRFQAPSEPSRVDHIYMTKPECASHSVLNIGTSDHRVLELRKWRNIYIPEPQRIRKRCFKNFKRSNFINDLKKIKWFPDVYMEEDLDEVVRKWEEKIRTVLDKHCPVKTIDVRKNYTPWLSQEMKALHLRLGHERRFATNFPSIQQQQRIDHLAGLLRRKLRSAEMDWMAAEMLRYKNDSSKTWQCVKRWAGWRTEDQVQMLKDDNDGGKVVRGSRQLSEFLNDYFSLKVKKIKDNMKNEDGDPTLELKRMLGSRDRKPKFKIKYVTEKELLKAAQKMSNKTSMGDDDIPQDLFKLIVKHGAPSFLHIVNLSIREGKFPDRWKLSKIKPLHKGGDKTSPKQYRPVALLPAGARLLERLIADQVVLYLEAEELLHSSNHGFRSKHGTETAVAEAQGVIYDAIEREDIVGMITLDQSAAFDVIQHSILESKLYIYGFDDHSVKWFANYLKGRRQYVALQSSKSKVIEVGDIACPQGSCLGPLLWNLYSGEIPEVVAQNTSYNSDQKRIIGGKIEISSKLLTGWVIQYADDIMYLLSRKTVTLLKSAAEKAYSILAPWFRRAKLQLNASKTHWMYICTQQKKTCIWEAPLLLENQRVEAVNCEKVLGVTFEGNLSMREHICRGEFNVLRRVKDKMKALWKIRNCLSFKARKSTASGIVLSKLFYCGSIWIPSATKSEVREAQVIQNQVMRFICGNHILRQEDLLRQTGFLSVRQRGVYHMVMLGLKVGWEGKPLNLHDQLISERGLLNNHDWREVGQTRIMQSIRTFRHQFLCARKMLPSSFLHKHPTKVKPYLKEWIRKNIPANIGQNDDGIVPRMGD